MDKAHDMPAADPGPADRGRAEPPAAAAGLTPAGVQRAGMLFRRRATVAALNLATWLGLLAVAAAILGAGGWGPVDAALLLCVAVGSPWTVLGFWNAVLGLWLLHFARDGLARAAPFAAAGDGDAPIRLDTAVLLTVRNEDPARAFARLRAVEAELAATGFGGRFAFFVLSDTSDPAIAAAEEAEHAAWLAAAGGDPARRVYRRRADNAGFKAGNLREFCARHGARFDLMLPLDADSAMSGAAVLRLVRIAQAHPRIGILQSLVVGMPSRSAFARLFQFGMRHGMRSYTIGAAWWGGDCGPFWGHNAVVRIAPFIRHCTLPVLPGGPPLGGAILSHDQIEAALMRRAGWEVRVLPVEDGSWEENPPTLPEFARRDLRWCQGNLQYLKLLDLPGLPAMSRFQILWAILMFLGIPAWTLAIALAPAKALLDGADPAFPGGLALGAYVVFLAMTLAPKLAGLADILLTAGGTRRYGGTARFLGGAAAEFVFSFLLGAATTFRTTLFMLALPFGGSVGWSGQARDAHALGWRDAAANLWPQALFGALVCAGLAAASPAALLWSLPLVAGYLLAVPLAVWSADPALGAWFVRRGFAGVPEDFAPPPVLQAFQR